MDVLLGVCDSPCPNSTVSPFTNKVGGLPDFFPSARLSAPPTCSGCGSALLLLVQMYCPLEGSPYHRLFHVFCCCSSSCWKQHKGWVVLRSQELDKHDHYDGKSGIEQTPPTPVQEWCEDADDWGSESEVSVVLSEPTQRQSFAVKEGNVDIDLPSEMLSMSLSTYTGPSYPSFYVNVFAEKDLSHETAVDMTDIISNGSTAHAISHETALGEEYECSFVSHGDRTFMKFTKEISKCPNQIIRYVKGGRPLLSSDSSVIPSSPVCQACGSESTFEFQIMPQLVYILQRSTRQSSVSLEVTAVCDLSKQTSFLESDTDLGIPEFGTILVYTCGKSCWNDIEQNYFKREITCVELS